MNRPISQQDVRNILIVLRNYHDHLLLGERKLLRNAVCEHALNTTLMPSVSRKRALAIVERVRESAGRLK